MFSKMYWRESKSMLSSAQVKEIQKRIKWLPFAAFFKREIHRFSKVFVQTIFIPVINASLYLVIFGISLGSRLHLEGLSYLEFIIPGLVMMSCLSNAFQNSASSILSLKFAGDIVDVRVSPMTIQQTLWALAFGGVCRGVFVGGLVLLIGELFHFYYLDRWLIPHSAGGLLVFSILAGLVFSKMGVVIALWARTFDHIGAVGGLVITPLTYLGGVFFSLDMLSPFWQKVSLFNPILYFINGVRWSLIGVSDVIPAVSLIVSVLALILCHAAGVFMIKNSRYYRRW